MTEIKTINIDCPLCDSKDHKYQFSANLGLKIVRCNRCSLLYANPQPTSQSLKDFYNPGLGRWIEEEEYAKRRDPYFKFYRDLLTRYSPYATSVLDIGCGTGIFLQSLKQRFPDIVTVGIELSPTDANVAKSRVDHILSTDVSSAKLPAGISQISAITAFDLMEHLPEPNKALSNIHSLLQPRGLLIIDTGDVGGFGARLGRSFNPFVHDAGHIVFYTHKTIMFILQSHGFRIRNFHSEKEVYPNQPMHISQFYNAIKRRLTSAPNMIVVAEKNN